MFIPWTLFGKLKCLLFKKHTVKLGFFDTYPNKADAYLRCIYCGKIERIYQNK